MKLQNTALLAILATSTLTSAAPTVANNGETGTRIVKRQDVNEVMAYLDELKSLKVKRDEILDEDTLMELQKREDNVIGNLISALSNSGLIGDVIRDLTSSPELTSSIGAIVKAALQAAVVQGPNLIRAIWNSGLLQNVFNTILNDGELRSALLAAGRSLFSTALNLLSSFFGNGGNDNAAPAPSGAAPAKREIDLARAIVLPEKRSAILSELEAPEKRSAEVDEADLIAERDIIDIVGNIVSAIADSGIVQNLFSKIMEDPQASIDFLTNVLRQGIVVVEDIYGWAKESGILQEGIDWLANSDNGIISTLGEFLAGALGNGSVSAEEFDNSGSSTTPATTGAATTGAATQAAGAATTAAAGSDSTGTDLAFLSRYAQEGATTLYRAKRMAY